MLPTTVHSLVDCFISKIVFSRTIQARETMENEFKRLLFVCG